MGEIMTLTLFLSYKAILSFHDKYGDTIRLGPNLVAVADKDMIKQVLVTDDFPKATIYEAFQSKLYSCNTIHPLVRDGE
jgi:hypothetical protein